MKRFLLFFAAMAMALAVMAVPARRGTFTVTQSDGTVLTLRIVGDEHFHYYQNITTGQIMFRSENGDFYEVSDTEFIAGQERGNVRRTAANVQLIKRLKQRTGGPRRVGAVSGGMTGTKKGLVILVNFSDTEMASAHTQSVFNNQFNQEGYSDGGHLGSVHDFFYDQSYGVFDLEFDVVGPVTVSNKMSYYGANDSSGEDKYPATMVIEACKLADAAGTNFADYDWDGDGEVDQVLVIYAGYGESYDAPANTIWPHEGQLSEAETYGDGSGALTLDGVKIDTYACSCELSGTSGTTLNGIGTACHEFSHCLGFPDFYDTSYAGGFGMNAWDLMDAGSYNGPDGCGEVPAGYTSYERWCAGWLTPTELTDPATISSMKALGDSPEAYIIYNDKNSDEYILLENRQNEKWFNYVDTYTTPHGLLAIHVDYDETAWENDKPNNTASHQRMSIIPASGKYGSKQTSDGETYYDCDESCLKGHPFSGSSSYTFLTGTSNSSSGGKWFTACSTGSTTLNHELTEIANASDGTISFLFDGGAVVDDGSRYTVTFNAGTGTCSTASWTQTDFKESTTLPSVTSPSEDWTFIGWSATEYGEESSTKPSTLYDAGITYRPTSDVTLYAIFKQTTTGTGESGSYTLDYSAEPSLQSTTLGYGNAVNYTATDGSAWVVKAYKNSGLQINKGKDASIKVPECPGNISSIEITDKTAKVLSFSADDYTGSNTPTAAATSSSSTTATLDLSSANLTTGYIYTTDGATVITKIVVNYGAGSTTTYYTYPSDVVLVTPIISFAAATQNMLVGDADKVIAATVKNSTGAISYTSSNTRVATVDASTGKVSVVGEGTTTITATVAAVSGVSRAASASYTLTITMPALSGIAVTTQPIKTTYIEEQTFNADGMVVTATYANGYQKVVENYTLTPSATTSLTPSDTQITVSYTEGGVTATAVVPVTVTALAVPSIVFAETADKNMFVGDTYTNIATATNSTGAISYTSSDKSIASVDATTGIVTARATGTVTVTATVAAVYNESKEASTTYTINVAMPVLKAIAIKTPANTVNFKEGDVFKATGLVLTATYENGYTQEITISKYTTEPAAGTTLTTDITEVTVSYAEGDVTKTLTYAITVSTLPKYTVTFDAGTGYCGIKSLTENSYQSGVTLPSAKISSEDWTFAGWATAAVETTNTKPSELLAEGTSCSLAADVTLYAVYVMREGGTANTFQYTTEITSGEEYIFVSKNSAGSAWALDATKITQGVAATVVDNDGIMEVYDPAETSIWTVTGRKSSMQLLNGDYYLKLNGSGLGMDITSSNVYWSDSYGLYGKSSSGKTSYYVKVGNTGILNTPSNGSTGSKRFYLYKRTSSAVTTYSSTPKALTIVDVANLIDKLNSGTDNHQVEEVDSMADKVLLN